MGFPITRTPITGSITASGQSFVVPVLQANFALVQLVATSLSGHACNIEGSIDSTTGADGSWFGISASRSNALGIVEPTTGTLAATPAYFWRINCAGMKYIRFRATAHTGGTASYSAYTLQDEIDGVIGGVVSLTTSSLVGVQYVANATGAGTPHQVNTTASTNAAVVKASPGRVIGYHFANTTASWRYVKLHNSTAAPTVGTTAVFVTIPVPPNEQSIATFEGGKGFSAGITRSVVTGAADTDATATGAGDVVGYLVFA